MTPPESGEREEAPLPLPLGRAHTSEDLVAEGLREMLVEELDRRRQVNLDVARSRSVPFRLFPFPLVFSRAMNCSHLAWARREEGHGSKPNGGNSRSSRAAMSSV